MIENFNFKPRKDPDPDLTGDNKMANKDQREWYKKFYEGTFLVKGWKSRMNDVLKGLSPEDKGEMSELLESLGKKIGMEWAKPNDVRRIDTAQLQQWGKDLQNARQKGSEALAGRIQQLNGEVDKKLA
jgi:hypothetical protein